MAEMGKWCIDESELENLNPIKVRDLMIDCFFHAQKATIAKAKELLKAPGSDDDIMSSIQTTIRLAFDEAGGDFNNPTRDSLAKVVGILAAKAALWHTPREIIECHQAEITKAINRLPFD